MKKYVAIALKIRLQMTFAPFNEFFPEIASTETRNVTFLVPIPLGPPPGKYHFIEMFCMDPKCDCQNAIIAVYGEETPGIFQEVTFLRFCWEDNDFYKSIGLNFDHDDLPGIFPDYRRRSVQFDDFFVQQLGNMCYRNFNESPSLRCENDYAKRIKRHYSLFKEHITKKAIEKAGSKIGRNENCPCGSAKKYKKCCDLLSNK